MNNKKINYLRNEISRHESIKPSINGEGNYHWRNRLFRLQGFIYAGAIGTINPYLSLLLIPHMLDGIGDIITGKHHNLLYRLTKSHPDHEIEKLEKEIMIEMIE